MKKEKGESKRKRKIDPDVLTLEVKPQLSSLRTCPFDRP